MLSFRCFQKISERSLSLEDLMKNFNKISSSFHLEACWMCAKACRCVVSKSKTIMQVEMEKGKQVHHRNKILYISLIGKVMYSGNMWCGREINLASLLSQIMSFWLNLNLEMSSCTLRWNQVKQTHHASWFLSCEQELDRSLRLKISIENASFKAIQQLWEEGSSSIHPNVSC